MDDVPDAGCRPRRRLFLSFDLLGETTKVSGRKLTSTATGQQEVAC